MSSAFIQSMDSTTRSRTENGAACISNVGDALLALFVKLERSLDDSSLDALFAAACAEATTPEKKADLFVLAYYTRATRGMGKGEKSLFYRLMLRLASDVSMDAATGVLSLVPHYGYWKDLLAIVALSPCPSAITNKCLELMAEQLKDDETELATAKAASRTPKVSLAGKYAPREGSAFDKSGLRLAKKLAERLYGGANAASAARKYRKLVASLNAALNTTEVLMAADRWSEIKFAHVSSLCLQRHRKAFLNEDLKGTLRAEHEVTGNRHPNHPGRVAARQHLRDALTSKKGVQGKELMPHEIVQKCMHGKTLSTLEADLLDAQWQSMRSGTLEAMAKAAEVRANKVAEATGGGLASLSELAAALPKHVDLGKLVPLVDVSGSMTGLPMEVAIALGILVSECTSLAFKDRVLTFESHPSWVDLSSCATIKQKVAKVQTAPWGGSTDFAAACERILAAAESAKLTPDEVPDLIVFSDMQFDMAGGFGGYGYYGGYDGRTAATWETHFERLQRHFAEVGVKVCGEPYATPRIIFWNLRSSVGFPVAKDAPNTQMLSGFSPALLKLVVSGADLVAEEQEVVQSDGTVKVVRTGPTPAETLRAALDDAAFDAVRLKLSEVETGPLAAYAFDKEDGGFALVDVV